MNYNKTFKKKSYNVIIHTMFQTYSKTPTQVYKSQTQKSTGFHVNSVRVIAQPLASNNRSSIKRLCLIKTKKVHKI